MFIFKLTYWAALVAQIFIRAPYAKGQKAAPKTDRRVSATETILVGLLSVFVGIFPLIYSLTNWLDFANYTLPDWLGWLGVVIMILSLLLFWRAHHDLKSNWSPTLEIRQDQTLITNGIYRYIRHPMYASQFVWAIAQILLLQNWLAGPLNLIFFTLFYILRARPEEQMMIDRFGDQYRDYLKTSGGIIPKWPRGEA